MKRRNSSMHLYKKIVVSFIGLTIALVLIVLYISLAEARINLTVEKKEIGTDFIIDVSENPQDDQSLMGEIFLTEMEGSKVFESSGEKSIKGKAGGEVVIYNNYSKDQPLVATTRFLSPGGLLYRLEEGVIVPAGGQVATMVFADQEGTAYEIEPSKFIIPGLWEGLQDKIYAESLVPMSGGDKQIRVVTESDIENAKNDLMQELFAKAKNDLKNKINEEQSINDKTTFKEIVESTVDAIPEEKMEDFTVNMKLKVVSVILDESKLFALAETKLRSDIPEDEKIININKDSLVYSLEKYDQEDGMVNLKIYLEGAAGLREDSNILNKNSLVGLSKEEAEAYLSGFEEIKEVEVNFYPFWIRKIPELKDHIKINLQYQ